MAAVTDFPRQRRVAFKRIPRVDLDRLLAKHYREQGWQVECCTAEDAGIDFKLRRSDQLTLVQCAHWEAPIVPNRAVHDLLDAMADQHATSAVLISGGEFTAGAIYAAMCQKEVRLIDGPTLLAMLDPPITDAEPTLPPGNAIIDIVERLIVAGQAEPVPRSGLLDEAAHAGWMELTIVVCAVLGAFAIAMW